MKSTETNPFYELFFTDSTPANKFVDYFSPFLVPHIEKLFLRGNVILKGTQGCGKSMLLNLFQPEIRVAYARRIEEKSKQNIESPKFPIPEKYCDFIGAGANLSKSGLLDIVQRLPSNPTEEDFQNLTALFCDFLNYWLFRDLLQSLNYIADNKSVFKTLVLAENFDRFVRKVREQDCWFGYLRGCRTFSDLRKRVEKRIVNYRTWSARNINNLDQNILESKTIIGEPLSRAADCLRDTNVINERVEVFLRLDQIEELWHHKGNQATLTNLFRESINRVIGTRDLRVSFRIGTRRYGWSSNISMPGGRQIEESRDYHIVDIDNILRRREDISDWLFDGFAEDVFKHRLKTLLPPNKLNLHSYFDRSLPPHKLIEKLILTPPNDPQKLLKLDSTWPSNWRKYIFDIYNKKICRKNDNVINANYDRNPLDAILAVAWGLQTGGIKGKKKRRLKPPPEKFPPWTKWWEKERYMLAVMQLVARHHQTLFWGGTERILSLSASNIMLFISICSEIWDQWKRREGDDSNEIALRRGIPLFSWKSQAVSIDNVSKNWHRNFARQPGRPGGDVRMRFVDALGNMFRNRMLKDISMSYPGGNGFSLRISELKKYPKLAHLLEEAVGWGDLYEVHHTTKISNEKNVDPRKKYYLNPILSPYFQIPEAHTKEPLYEPIEKILKIAEKAKALIDDRNINQKGF